jgi:hypothetical protein
MRYWPKGQIGALKSFWFRAADDEQTTLGRETKEYRQYCRYRRRDHPMVHASGMAAGITGAALLLNAGLRTGSWVTARLRQLAPRAAKNEAQPSEANEPIAQVEGSATA